MPKNCDIRLRGHHLYLLYNFDSNCRKSEPELSELGLGNLGLEVFKNNLKSYGRYGRKDIEHFIKVLERICNGSIRVKLTDGLDAICRGCHWRKEKVCRERDSLPLATKYPDGDYNTIKNLGFKLGKVYRSQYLLRKLRKGKI